MLPHCCGAVLHVLHWTETTACSTDRQEVIDVDLSTAALLKINI